MLTSCACSYSCCCIQETPFSGNHSLTLTLTFLPTLLPQRLLVLGRDGTIQELWWFEWEWPTEAYVFQYWTPVGETVWEKLGRTDSLEEVYQRG